MAEVKLRRGLYWGVVHAGDPSDLDPPIVNRHGVAMWCDFIEQKLGLAGFREMCAGGPIVGSVGGRNVCREHVERAVRDD